jgi:hypothetical protein
LGLRFETGNHGQARRVNALGLEPLSKVHGEHLRTWEKKQGPRDFTSHDP